MGRRHFIHIVILAVLLGASPARGDDETRLMPPGLQPGDPAGVPSARPPPWGSGWISLRLGYGQHRGGGNALDFGEAQLGAGIGFFDRLEISSSITGRYSTGGGLDLLAFDPLQVQAKVLLRRAGDDREGDEGGVALAAGARIPLHDDTDDPRIGYRLALITDERFSFGLRVTFRVGAELRLADERRPVAALFDLGLGLSYEIWSRFELNVFASGTMRVSLMQLPASLLNPPATGQAGIQVRAARDLYVDIGGCYDHRPSIDNGGPMGWCLYGNTLWTPGRAAALERAARKALRVKEAKEAEEAEEARRPAATIAGGGRKLVGFVLPKDLDLVQAGRDATAAVERANRLYLGPALAARGMEAIEEIVRGTAIGLAVTATLVGATIYYQASMKLTLLFLRWLGITSLSMIAAARIATIGTAFDEFISTIAFAHGDPAKIDLAARQYADAVAIVTGAAGEALFFLAAAEGLNPVLKRLEGSNLSRTLGANRLRDWLAEGVRKIKGQSKSTAPSKAPAATSAAAGPRAQPPTRPAPPVGEVPRLTPENVEQVRARGGVSDAEIGRIQKSARTKNEKWNLPVMVRGKVSHALRGENLPHGFEVIDRIHRDASGKLVQVDSLKSIQPYAKSYRKPGALYNKLKMETDKLAEFKFGSRGGVKITMDPTIRRVLEFEVPPDTIGPEIAGRPQGDPALRGQWRSEAAAAIEYARTRNVELRFTEAVQP